MAGIYLHIPFCRKLCGYCDFFKNTSLQHKEALLAAMLKEINLRKEYINEAVGTIYFGGGTPSTLTIEEVAAFLKTIRQNFIVTENAEVTFEANPDDLTPDYLHNLKAEGINRLSIGIQSFDDTVLQFMNRRHTAAEAIRSVENARRSGFENLSLDIIYGIPATDVSYLQTNLEQLCALQPTHISAYHLTIEQGTTFAHLRNKGKLQEITDENSSAQYTFLIQFLQQQGYEQYEISNFCKDNKIAKHNTNYWMQTPYLGIGPSAHSYNQKSRHWNVSNLKKYTNTLQKEQLPCESETLNTKDQFNDYVMVRLRTKWGIDLEYIRQNFGANYVQNVLKTINAHSKDFKKQGSHVCLKSEAFLHSDYLIAKFFVI